MARHQDPRTKVELLRAAEAVFVEHGLDRAKVEEITARAGRSKGSFYLHFESKEAAFKQIVETLLARLSTCIHEPPGGEGPLDLEAFTRWALDHDVEVFEFLWANRGVMGLLLGGGGSAAFGYLVDEFAEQSRSNVKTWLLWGIEHGLYRKDIDLEIASLAISGAYDRYGRHLVRLPRKPNLRVQLLELSRTIVGGIATPAMRHVFDRLVIETKKLP